MNVPNTTPGGDGPQGTQTPSAAKGLLTLILVSVSILLLGWGLMALLDRIL